ncbi:MAG: right-handed parallel beta-helix repeat-containing protein, partial [Pirellula sp.]
MDLYKLLVVFFLLAGFQSGLAGEIHVRPGGSNPAVAIKSAKPGDVVLIHPGIYGGGQWIKGIRGTPEQVITIRAAEPKSPPVISGGPAGWQFSACSHLVIEDIVFEHQTDNGLNIDDDGLYKKGNLYAATNIHLKRIVVRDLNAEGNNDGIKLSGLRDFTVNDCRISNWGKVGCGLDMVGCTDGKIVGVIADGCHKGGWGIQAKGGSDGILIQDCQVRNVTQRGIQVGGVTGPDSFREKGSVWEAKKIQIESCDVYGGDASIAIIHAMDVSIKSCRWIHPKKWFFRFLNENNSFGFQASRNVLIQENLFVATEANFIGPVNSGILWNPSIRFEDNIWYHETIPNWDLRLGLPSGELRGVACVNPPSSFLRKDFVVTKSRFEQLLSLLSDEIPQREFIVRLKWFSTIFSLVFLWVGLWIFSLGAKVDSMSVARQRVKGNSIGRWFLFLLALVFLLLHMDLPPGFSDFDEVIKEAKSDRFELLVRASFLGGGVVLMLTCFDRVLLGISDSLWLSFFWGIFSGVSIYGLEYLNECRLGRFDVDRNHISIDASVGLFSGVLAHGFARDIRAWFLRLSRR